MSLYPYPQPMYRSDGFTLTCNSDADVAALPTAAGATWAPTPWSPGNYTSGVAQSNYDAMASQDATLAAEVIALTATVNADNAIMTNTGQ